jgi:hypothetical protein
VRADLYNFKPVDQPARSPQANTMPSELDAFEQDDDCAASIPKRSHIGLASKKTKAVKAITTFTVLDLSIAAPTPYLSLTRVVSLLVASLASFRLQLNALDEVCSSLHDGRLSAFQGDILSLLDSVNLNAAFSNSGPWS